MAVATECRVTGMKRGPAAVVTAVAGVALAVVLLWLLLALAFAHPVVALVCVVLFIGVPLTVGRAFRL